jgi:hypothetical protein
VNGIEDEMEQRPFEKPRYQTGVHDPVLRQLITLLAYETKQGGPSGLLYAEHLAHALAIRLLVRATTETTQSRAAKPALPPHLLRRVRDRILGHMAATQRLGSIQYPSGTIFALFAGRG